MNKRTLLAVTLGTLFIFNTALADLRVVVTPTRTIQSERVIPANVAVMGKKEIARSGAVSLADALKGLNGVVVIEGASGPVVSMRGASSNSFGSNVLILVDGQRLNRSDLSSPDLSSVSISNIERIEVLNGSAGVRYGDQAVAGVINIITDSYERPNQTITGNVKASGGSFNRKLLGGDIAVRLAEGLKLNVNAETLKTDNFRENNEQTRDTARVGLSFSNDRVSRAYLDISAVRNNLASPGQLSLEEKEKDRQQSRPEFRDDFSDTNTTGYRSGLSVRLNDTWDYHVDINQRESDTEYAQSFRNFRVTRKDTIERDKLEINPRFEFKKTKYNRTVSWLTGVDYQQNKFVMTTPFIERDNTQVISSGYSTLTLPVVSYLDVVLGIRRSLVSDDLTDKTVYPNGEKLTTDKTSKEIGLNVLINDSNRIFVRFDEGFRFAKVGEQAYTSPGVLGLKPQKSDSLEVGYDYSTDKINAHLMAYQVKTEDGIVFDSTKPKPIGGGFNGANVNQDKTEQLGAQLGVDWSLSSKIDVGLSAGYVDAFFTEGVNKDKKLTLVPEYNYRLFGGVEVINNLYVSTEFLGFGARYLDEDKDNSQDKLKSYDTVNFSTRYKLNNWQFSLRANNVTNAKYDAYAKENGFAPKETFSPAAGSNYWFTTKYTF